MELKKETILDVLRIAMPAVFEMTLYTMIGVFDTMMVGQYGGDLAVSSVGLSTETIYTFSNILVANGISVGISSLVARKVGAKKDNHAEEYATLGFLFAFIISLFTWLILFFFSTHLFKAIGTQQNIITTATPFIKIASIGIFFSMLMNSLNASIRGCGNTKTPLIASLIVTIINLALDYVLIFGKFGAPSLGVTGSGIATCTAQILGFIFILFYMIKYAKIKVRFKYIREINFDMVNSFLRLSIPSSMQEGAFSISRLISNFFIVALGSLAFAANQITTSIESISFMPGWGFAIAATTLVGQKIGEKNYKNAKEYAYASLFLGTLVMLICSAMFLLIPNQLVSLFINSSAHKVVKEGTLCVMIASIEQPFIALSMIAGGILKGAGDTKTPFKVSMISSWIIRMPLMFIFIHIMKLSVIYVWIITSIQWIFDGTLIFILFIKKFRKLTS